jgi:hypothetical protein
MGTLVIKGSAPGGLFQNGIPNMSWLIMEIGHNTSGATSINNGIGSLDTITSVPGWLIGNTGARALGFKLVRVDTL